MKRAKITSKTLGNLTHKDVAADVRYEKQIAVEAYEKGLLTCRGSRNLYSRENFQKHNHTLGGVKATKKELDKKPTPEQKRILELIESYEPT
ncbi:hypothetical protein AAVH_29214, partial [Aphelenchoides avenae]